ncbi:uncharacterized protein Z519_08138 [Cladophialophora bantiana CBS 173.52]|uniref:Uncharacterized protein n=1 Tax=Cladophialophora bantiana (strain ATCC 10958 / CBS 173.52 / CDC B-1940 / NIH 8579) TaxID=1442370 RepID=A0A0D2FXN0_CLAB1|nr:uncharacterized protein Z519_08138 [Cladophialophora bantiana CBS 173.52]KIW91242.1 hypothetical protein Z519_08138 [Cladophialophora bantiana CBS 173.52]
MVAEAPASYSPIPRRDEENGANDGRGEAHEEVQNDVQNSAHDAETTNVPIIEISPPPSPPSPPTRVNTDNSDNVSVAQTLSRTRPVEQPPNNKRYSNLSVWKERIYNSVTPSLHEILELKYPDHSTSREYRHHKQRNRLLRLTIGEWINTLALCVVYFSILYAYSKKDTINVPQRRVFNALTTGVSLLLGVNLAASLRSYAKLLRWRMLAACYRPLETFDLVMGCDSLLNVIKLLWKARNQKRKFLPSRTQILCVLWLLVHLAVTVLVGIIGLNYNMDTSADYVLTQTGSTSIVDLNSLSTGDYSADLAAVQQWGIRGEVTTPLDQGYDVEEQQGYYSSFQGYTRYYFQDQNADDPNRVIISSRYIESLASCQDYTVSRGQYGNLSYIIYNNGKKDVNQSLPATPGPGGLLFISKLNSTCGDRCVEIHTFQAAPNPDSNDNGDDDDDGGVGTYFICNNTVPQVQDDHNELTSEYLTEDVVGRMLAGAIGWSDNPPTADGKEEYAVYTNSSEMSFPEALGPWDVADLISSFTMGAISFMDNSPAMYRKTVISKEQPIAAQVLNVTWRYAGAILAVIPFIHFCTLVAVILWANKAIIKDDSHLAIAKAYHTLLRELGDRGCLLRGDEIVSVLGNPPVAYGWQASGEYDRAMHVDVFHNLTTRTEKPFAEGWYDGNGYTNGITTGTVNNTGLTGRVRRRYRDVDAADYF